MADHNPAVPTSAVRVARIGGTTAEIAAAAISAHTLYHLGGQLSLGPWAAWLLPAALDIYAFTSLAVGYSLRPSHPAQRPVLRTARLAFAMTLGCNALDHFLQKAGRLIDPTVRDLLLVAVATLPPLVVERLLNLQSLLVGHHDHVAPLARDDVATVLEARVLGKAALAHDSTNEPVGEIRDDHPVTFAASAVTRPDWTAHGRDVFATLVDQLGRRPSGPEFQGALAAHAQTLIADGRLPAATRPPSVSSAKRIRATLEAESTVAHRARGVT